MSDLVVLHEVPDSKHGTRPEERSIEERIRLGVAIVDKPTGPTSHQVSAWVRDMFGVPKAGPPRTPPPRLARGPPGTRGARGAGGAERESTQLESTHRLNTAYAL